MVTADHIRILRNTTSCCVSSWLCLSRPRTCLPLCLTTHLALFGTSVSPHLCARVFRPLSTRVCDSPPCPIPPSHSNQTTGLALSPLALDSLLCSAEEAEGYLGGGGLGGEPPLLDDDYSLFVLRASQGSC